MRKDERIHRKIPDEPGVYFFLGKNKEILYIGRATSLKNRVRSYFDAEIHEKRSVLIQQMVEAARTIEWTVTDSVLEAMILETNLIRTHKPEYNTISKDDKSYNHLVITDEEFPRVLVVRAKDLTLEYRLEDLKYVFGPFPSGMLFKEALKIIRRLFQFYDMEKPLRENTTKMGRGKIDFNRQIGLYPNVQSKAEYNRTIRHIKLFFEGKKQRVIRELEKEMHACANNEQFEKAHLLKRKISALRHIEDVALIKDDARIYRDEKNMRIEAYDIAHLSGSDMVGVMVVLEGGIPSKNEYRKFKIKSVTTSNDPAALCEVVERRLAHSEWPLPQILIVDGGAAQRNAVMRVLKRCGTLIPVVGVVKNEMHKPVRLLGSRSLTARNHNEILLANSESHRFALAYHRYRRKKRNE